MAIPVGWMGISISFLLKELGLNALAVCSELLRVASGICLMGGVVCAFNVTRKGEREADGWT